MSKMIEEIRFQWRTPTSQMQSMKFRN